MSDEIPVQELLEDLAAYVYENNPEKAPSILRKLLPKSKLHKNYLDHVANGRCFHPTPVDPRKVELFLYGNEEEGARAIRVTGGIQGLHLQVYDIGHVNAVRGIFKLYGQHYTPRRLTVEGLIAKLEERPDRVTSNLRGDIGPAVKHALEVMDIGSLPELNMHVLLEFAVVWSLMSFWAKFDGRNLNGLESVSLDGPSPDSASQGRITVDVDPNDLPALKRAVEQLQSAIRTTTDRSAWQYPKGCRVKVPVGQILCNTRYVEKYEFYRILGWMFRWIAEILF